MKKMTFEEFVNEAAKKNEVPTVKYYVSKLTDKDREIIEYNGSLKDYKLYIQARIDDGEEPTVQEYVDMQNDLKEE